MTLLTMSSRSTALAMQAMSRLKSDVLQVPES
jgi:hypothetical protein